MTQIIKDVSTFHSDGMIKLLEQQYHLQAKQIHIEAMDAFYHFPIYIKTSLLHKKTMTVGVLFDKTGFVLKDENHVYDVVEKLLLIAKQKNIQSIDIRTPYKIKSIPAYQEKVELSLALPDNTETAWMKLLKSDTRRKIRKTYKGDYVAKAGNSNELLNDFYPLYEKNIHALGSLPMPKNFFQQAIEYCGNDLQIYVGYVKEKPVCGAVNFLSNNECYNGWNAFDRSSRLYLNKTQVWEMMKLAIEAGRNSYNFGRSTKGTGSYRFKKSWKASEKPIYYYRIDTAENQHRITGRIKKSVESVIKKSHPIVMKSLSRVLVHRFF